MNIFKRANIKINKIKDSIFGVKKESTDKAYDTRNEAQAAIDYARIENADRKNW